MDITFEHAPTVSEFMQCNARQRYIVGPFGSGKTVGSLVELPRRAGMQEPAYDPETGGRTGLRKSRWAVVRNTTPQLKDTTMKSWLDRFPDGSLGYMERTTKTYHIRQGGVQAEICFRALDDKADVANLLGLELTGANLAEFREISRDIVEPLDGRIDRYPRIEEGGATWAGIWGDSNMPEDDSYWWALMEGKDPDDHQVDKPNDIRFFRQPPAMIKQADGTYVLNPRAENLAFLSKDYYPNLVKDKTDDFIRVNVLVQYGRSKGGKPVHPMYNPDIHRSAVRLIPSRALLLLIAADFGRTPAMVLKQQDAFGRVLTLDEIVSFDMAIETAIEEKLLPLLRSKRYGDGYEIFVTGDPSGDAGGQNTEASCADIFRKYKRKGLGQVKMAWSNVPLDRQAATDHFLSRLVHQGRPAYLIDPMCVWLHEALNGKYMFKKTKDGRHSDEVDKNDWSHTGEANEYGDMYFERGGRSKAAVREKSYEELLRAQQVTGNIYASPR